MKIDDLMANLERNAQEQDKIMTEKIQSVTSQHLASYNELLQQNLKATQSIISDHQTSLQQGLKSMGITKTTTGAVIGLLAACMLGISLANLWLYKKHQRTAEQLEQIQQNIKQSPVQAQALAKLDIGQNKDGTIWMQPKNPKNFEVGTDNTNKKPLIFLK